MRRPLDEGVVHTYARNLAIKFSARVCVDPRTDEEQLRLEIPGRGVVQLPLNSGAAVRRAIGPHLHLLSGNEPRQSREDDRYLRAAVQHLTQEDREERRCIVKRLGSTGDNLDEDAVQKMYEDLRDRSEVVEVLRRGERLKLHILGKDGRHHRLTTATSGKQADDFFYLLWKYVGAAPEDWAAEKGLHCRTGALHDFHAIKRATLEHVTAACRRLAEYSTWMLNETRRVV